MREFLSDFFVSLSKLTFSDCNRENSGLLKNFHYSVRLEKNHPRTPARSQSVHTEPADCPCYCQDWSRVLCRVATVKSPLTSSMVQIIFYFWSFEFNGTILRIQK